MTQRPLSSIPLFSKLPPAVVAKVARLVRIKNIAEGEIVFDEGASATSFFIIAKGQVAISKVSSHHEETTKTLAILEEGAFFGERALFEDRPRIARAQALGPITLFEITRQDFTALLKAEMEAALPLLSSLVSNLLDRLDATNRAMVTLYDTGRIVASSKNLTELLAGIFRRTLAALGASEGAVYLKPEFSEDCQMVTSSGYKTVPDSLEMNEPILKRLLKAQEVLLLDSETKKGLEGAADFYKSPSLLASPLFHQNKFLGFFLFSDEEPNRFGNDEKLLLAAVSLQTSPAILNLQHLQEEIARERLQRARLSR